MQILETPRLIVRYFTIRDAEDLMSILGDPQVMEFSILGVHDRQQIRQFLEQRLLSYLDPGFGLYALICKENSELVGYCGFFVQKIKERTEVEIGYRLAKQYWGKGLATEAAQALCQYGRQKFTFERFVCLIDSNNFRSIRVAQKLKMKFEKKIVYYGLDVNVYAINY